MELNDDAVAKAFRELERRAERQDSDLTLYNTYVDGGVLSEISDGESQVIYGRRGVGKTHLLRFHRHTIQQKNFRSPYFIFDCRLLGSGTASISDDPNIIGRNYAIEFLNELGNSLFDFATTLKLDKDTELKAQQTAYSFYEQMFSADGTLNFRHLASTFSGYCSVADIEKIYIGLDEYVSIPQNVQPRVANLIKQVFAMERKAVIKIAAVTYQTSLYAEVDGRQIGMEIGADVFSDIDLDSYFLWDENQIGVLSFFSQVIYNHVGEILGWDLAKSPVEKQRNVVSFFFTQERCLQELVRASEGNCRDLLNILRLAYSEYRRGSVTKMGVDHIATASKAWYRDAKLANNSTSTRDEEFLNFLIQDVIRAKKSRAFMVSYQHARHPLLLRLLNLRLLHRMRTTWTHPDRPGDPYHIFTIDYGCYADLKGTRAEPQQEIFFNSVVEGGEGAEIVPLPDRRSIRRIVLSRDDLDKYYVKQ